VPIVRDPGKARIETTYPPGRKSKTLAIGPGGAFFFNFGADSTEESARRILETCGAVIGVACMIVAADDVFVAMSNSGESEELIAILPLIKRLGAKLIAITGRPASSLAQLSDVHLNAGVSKEACPLNLAPTASTTAALDAGRLANIRMPKRTSRHHSVGERIPRCAR